MVSKKTLALNCQDLKELNAQYCLLCSVEFLPRNEKVPDFMKIKGYDYIARSKVCHILLKIRNISDITVPEHEILRCRDGRLGGLTIECSHGTQFCDLQAQEKKIPKLKPNQEHEISIRINRRDLYGDVTIKLEYQSLIKIVYSTDEILKNGFMPRPNYWIDKFFILSPSQEIEETDKHYANKRSAQATCISVFALIISMLTLIVLFLNDFVDIPKFHPFLAQDEVVIEKIVVKQPTNTRLNPRHFVTSNQEQQQ